MPYGMGKKTGKKGMSYGKKMSGKKMSYKKSGSKKQRNTKSIFDS